MPNNTTQRMIVNGESNLVCEVMQFIKGEPGSPNELLDLNKIVPMPEAVLKTIEFFSWENFKKKRTPEEKLEFEEQFEAARHACFQATGFNDWQEWRVENWGTRWNAYEVSQGSLHNELYFLSAWEPIIPPLIILSRIFPNVTIELEYIDEGERFIGRSFFNAGELECHYYDWEDPEAKDIRVRLWGQRQQHATGKTGENDK